MAGSHNAMASIADLLGPPLYTAALENDVAQVEILTSDDVSMDASKWSAAALAAASNRAVDVASNCVQIGGKRSSVVDKILWRVLGSESLYPSYYFLVDSKIVNVHHDIDRTGPLLSVAAGFSDLGKPTLVEFLLKKGADPSDRAEIHGGLQTLTSAAGNSDKSMVELLLRYGAQIRGSGALANAAKKGNLENVECLLARGADVNEMAKISSRTLSQDDVGSPLHKAVEYGQISVLDTLLNAGADVSLKDGMGRTARDIAEEKGWDANVLAALSPL